MEQVFVGQITEMALEEISHFSAVVSVGENRSDALPSLVPKHPTGEFRRGSCLRFGLYVDFPDTIADAFVASTESKIFLIHLGTLTVLEFQDKVFWVEHEADHSLIWLSKISDAKLGGRLLSYRAVRTI